VVPMMTTRRTDVVATTKLPHFIRPLHPPKSPINGRREAEDGDHLVRRRSRARTSNGLDDELRVRFRLRRRHGLTTSSGISQRSFPSIRPAFSPSSGFWPRPGCCGWGLDLASERLFEAFTAFSEEWCIAFGVQHKLDALQEHIR
jgi:hypothetical protein